MRRDIAARYRGATFGTAWAFIAPLMMLLAYTFVFGIVFESRWDNRSNNSWAEFALVLFAGLIVFNLFSECLIRAPILIVGNVNYVKRVVFPLEILPWMVVLTSLFQAIISLMIWLAASIALRQAMPPVTILWVPLIILPLILLSLGVTFLLAAVGAYVRDVSQFMTIMVTLLMFLAPVFYPLTAVPERYQIIISLNPVTIPIELMRDTLIWGRSPSFVVWFWSMCSGMLAAWIGFVWFQKTRQGFADVL